MLNTIHIISNNQKTKGNLKYFSRYFNFPYFSYENINQLNFQTISEINDIIIYENPTLNDLALIRKVTNVIIICIFKRYHQKVIIEAYEKGMDDYCTIPFSYVELFYKIKVFTKHRNSKPQDIIKYKSLYVNYNSKKTYINNEEVNLTNLEFMILYILLNNINSYVSKELLLKTIWKTNHSTRTVDTHICTLKKKLGVYSSIIKNKKNVGYYIPKED